LSAAQAFVAGSNIHSCGYWIIAAAAAALCAAQVCLHDALLLLTLVQV
jgi:hypothetical protein